VHGATVGERALIGMNAVVLNGATVGDLAVVGALTLVPQNFKVPPRSLAVGVPCTIRKTDDSAIAEMAFQNTERYHRYRLEHLAGMWGTVVGPANDGGTFSR
jgi:carbonic anhydrase/acetyltransferase-like protein (isoleucine patch superfamily)